MKNPIRLLSASALLGGILLGCLSDYQEQYKLRPDGTYKPLFKESSLKDCADRIDNDGNSFIDCDDPGCSIFEMCSDTTGAPAENTQARCKDGIDNDANALIDCKDLAGCGAFQFCLSPVENTPDLCQDKDDNDLDGFIDCKDSDCKGFLVCNPTENTLLLCKDGLDNDADILVDCKDPDCKDLYVCTLPSQDTVFIVDYKTTGKLSPAIRGKLPPYNLTWYFNGGDAVGGDALGLKGVVPGSSEETTECGAEPLCRKITFTDAWGIAFTIFFDNAGAQDTVDLSSWFGASLKLSIKTQVPNLRLKLEAKHLADVVEIPLADIGYDLSKNAWQEVVVPLSKWTTSYKLSTNRLPFSIWKPGGPGGVVLIENIRIE